MRVVADQLPTPLHENAESPRLPEELEERVALFASSFMSGGRVDIKSARDALCGEALRCEFTSSRLTSDSYSGFLAAVELGFLGCVKAGYSHQRNSTRVEALDLAFELGQVKIAQFLLEKGVVSSKGIQDLLSSAISRGDWRILEVLFALSHVQEAISSEPLLLVPALLAAARLINQAVLATLIQRAPNDALEAAKAMAARSGEFDLF